MADCPLSKRQKDLLCSIVPGLKDGTVETEWGIREGGGEIFAIFGLDRDGKLWREVWKDNLKLADLVVFEECGFLRQTGKSSYVLFEQAIIDAVESNFNSSTENEENALSPGQMIMSPVFGPPLSNKRNWPDVFVLMPFKDELKPIYTGHIRKVASNLDLTCERADDFFSADSIIDEVWSAIYYSRVCIADCTGKNPNVFYEMGIAHTIGKPCILIAQSKVDIPFDIEHRRNILYEYTPPGMQKFEENLRKTLKNILAT